MMVEKQTIPYLNALIRASYILGEQLPCSIEGCHATSSLKSVFFRRKVAWQPLIELHSWAWSILKATSRATKWGIICFCSLCLPSQILFKGKKPKGWAKINAIQCISHSKCQNRPRSSRMPRLHHHDPIQ